MVSTKYFKKIKEELDHCKNPLFFFDDDPDGLSSFLLLYRYKREGHGCIVKARPKITTQFLKKVEEYHPDKIFILDICDVDQAFLDKVSVPVIWIDHHPCQERNNVIYINPRLHDEEAVPTSYMCYSALEKEMKSDQWIAMVGCIGDWFVPDFKDEFCEKYPLLADPKYATPPEYLFETMLGTLIKIFSFNLKGNHSEAMKSIKILCRVNSPQEILEQEEQTSQAKFLYKKFEKINKHYEALKKGALQEEEKTKDDVFLVYIYEEDKVSLTKDLSNELLYLFPHKVIVLGRKKNGEVKCSLRSTKYVLPDALANALSPVEGYGGGHDHACGGCIKEKDFDLFLEGLRKGLDL